MQLSIFTYISIISVSICIYIYIYIYTCVCVCVCVYWNGMLLIECLEFQYFCDEAILTSHFNRLEDCLTRYNDILSYNKKYSASFPYFHTCIYIYIYIYTPIYIYIYIYKCVCVWERERERERERETCNLSNLSKCSALFLNWTKENWNHGIKEQEN